MPGHFRILLLAGALAAACGSTPAPPSTAPHAAPPPRPLAPGLALVDTSFDPCEDFEVYACGPRYGELAVLRRPGDLVGARGAAHRRLLKDVMNGKNDRIPGAAAIREYMTRCLDLGARSAGVAVLRRELDQIEAAHDLADLARSLGRLRTLGYSILVELDGVPQFVDGRQVLAAHLALTDPVIPAAFYSPVRGPALGNRAHWWNLVHLSRLAREDEVDPATRVDRWLALMHPAVDERIHSLTSIAAAVLQQRSFPWSAYFEGLGQRVPGPFWVVETAEIGRIDGLASLPLAALKSYARVVLIERSSMLLTQDLLDEEYRFHVLPFGYIMKGSWLPEWACGGLPQRLYDNLAYANLRPLADRESEDRARILFSALRDRLAVRIQRASSVAAGLREQTTGALRRLTPLFVEETSAFEPPAAPAAGPSFLDSHLAANRVQAAEELAAIGKAWNGPYGAGRASLAGVFSPADRVWLSPELVRPPYLGAAPWGPATYGGLGAIIGHELGHLIPRELWLAGAASVPRSSASADTSLLPCMGQLFDKLTVSTRMPFDLERSLHEFMPDLMGLSVAFEALNASRPSGAGSDVERLQAFFVAYAQTFCAMEGDNRANLDDYLDWHPSMQIRINGVLSQSPTFARAFGCQSGQPMAPEPRCTPW